MGWQLHPAFGPLLVSAGVAITVAVAVLRWRRMPGALALAGLMGGAAIWCVGYGIELSCTRFDDQIFWAKAQYVGIQTVPTFWLLFTAAYGGVPLTRSPRLALLLLVQPVAILALAWTNEMHGLIWANSVVVERGSMLVLAHRNGPLYLLNVAYAYALLLVGWAIVARQYTLTWGIYRRQALVILVGALFPWIGNALYVAGLAPLGYLDLTPFAFALSGAVASWGLVYYRMLDVVPLARDHVLDRLADPVVVLDDQERVVDLNSAARELVDPEGSDRLRILGRPAAAVLRGMPSILTLLQSPVDGPSEFSAYTHDRLREFEVQVVSLPRERGSISGRIVIAHDISERKQAERELLMARDRADAANRAKTTFLANVSHELRTPLSIIIGYGEMLHEGVDTLDRQQQAVYAERVLNSAQHLLALINEVLDLSKIEAGKLDLRAESFDADLLVEEVREAVAPLVARRHNRLVVETLGRLGTTCTDPLRVRQVLLNLLGNAAKFTSDGRVGLTAWRQSVADGDWLTFRVSDTGEGIAPDRLDTLFKPFSRGESRAGSQPAGVGLGLAVSHRVAQLLGGEITVASTVNVGSDFTFRVPASLTRMQS